MTMFEGAILIVVTLIYLCLENFRQESQEANQELIRQFTKFQKMVNEDFEDEDVL